MSKSGSTGLVVGLVLGLVVAGSLGDRAQQVRADNRQDSALMEVVYSTRSNEPVAFRVDGAPFGSDEGDVSQVFRSISRADSELNKNQTLAGQPINPNDPNGFTYPRAFTGATDYDPYTPLLRAYEGDNISKCSEIEIVCVLMYPELDQDGSSSHFTPWMLKECGS